MTRDQITNALFLALLAALCAYLLALAVGVYADAMETLRMIEAGYAKG